MMKKIRNFCIIAHIDHGKSTLADRLLQYTGTVNDRDFQDQVLDDMDLERERGITIKSHAIQMNYRYKGEDYVLNLIDTPGHVDFSYEVSRSIAACEGALLLVDATQGVQAQTISNLYLAIENDLEIIPVLNKMDMPAAMPAEVKDQIVDLIGCDESDIIEASGKTGAGVEEILSAIIERIPAPQGDPEAPLQALIFDSVFNSYRGIIAYFRIKNGTIRTNDFVKFMATGKEYHADEIGVLRLNQEPKAEMSAGDVGYIISGIKTSTEVRVGDTITHVNRPCAEAVAGFQEVKPMLFAGIYPTNADDYEELRASLEKLQLNDASLTFSPESSAALGFGFRCGFLGLLHMEIVQERLDREFDMDVIATVPNVSYKVFTTKREVLEVHNPSGMPAPNSVELIALKDAEIKYSTVQNWYPGDKDGNGGIYNLVTKRGLCEENAKISWTQVETGSAITWKYPGCVLRGNNSVGEFYSVAVTNNYQQADTGTKMIHIGKNTRSLIVSKGISAGKSQNSYRGLVKVNKQATNSRNFSQCDSLLMGDQCGAHTWPYIECHNKSSVMEHEATTSKISDDQLFYCQQRGIDKESAISLIVNGYAKEVLSKLPMEFAVEAQKLLSISLEGSIG